MTPLRAVLFVTALATFLLLVGMSWKGTLLLVASGLAVFLVRWRTRPGER